MAAETIARTAPICKTLHSCFLCNQPFYPKRTDRTKFCGRACGVAWIAYKASLRKTHGSVSVVTRRARCRACARTFTQVATGQWCSPECRAIVYRQRYLAPLSDKDCAVCGSTFTPARTGGRFKATCSDQCRDRQQSIAKRSNRAVRKARTKGTPNAERVDPLKVFERDAWKCCLCGRKTDKNKRGGYHPRSPELDHILPLSLGGEQTYQNTQCACRECNRKKGARPMGQIPLFPMA